MYKAYGAVGETGEKDIQRILKLLILRNSSNC